MLTFAEVWAPTIIWRFSSSFLIISFFFLSLFSLKFSQFNGNIIIVSNINLMTHQILQKMTYTGNDIHREWHQKRMTSKENDINREWQGFNSLVNETISINNNFSLIIHQGVLALINSMMIQMHINVLLFRSLFANSPFIIHSRSSQCNLFGHRLY